MRARVESRKITYHAAEEKALGLTHSEVGAHRLTSWGVASELVEAVAEHHRPMPGTLSGTVHLADVLAIRALGLDEEGPGWDYVIDSGVLGRLDPSLAGKMEDPAGLTALIGRVRLGFSEMAGWV